MKQYPEGFDLPEVVVYGIGGTISLAICNSRNVCSPYGDCRFYEWK
jgi:hypothetical protein